VRQINLIRKEVLVQGAIRDPLTDLLPQDNKGATDWLAFDNAHIIAFAQKFVEEKGITNRKGLRAADPKVYFALLNRRLVGKVIPESLHSGRRDWSSISDEELITLAQKFVEENGIRNRYGLEKADSGLNWVLRKRGLIGKIGFELEKRDWTSLSDDQLVSHAQKFVEEKEIGKRSGLEKADLGLYIALLRRKPPLIDAVFAPLEQKKEDELFGQLTEAVDAYTN
jgi:hypothetical protein